MGMKIQVRMSRGIEALKKDPQLVQKLKEHSPELRDILVRKVRERTPVRTGALQSSITGRANTGGSSTLLVTLYTRQGPQLAAWNRVYGTYQEGPPLGRSTYTNGPHQMFYRVDSDDSGDIQTWADKALGDWADSLEGMGEEEII